MRVSSAGEDTVDDAESGCGEQGASEDSPKSVRRGDDGEESEVAVDLVVDERERGSDSEEGCEDDDPAEDHRNGGKPSCAESVRFPDMFSSPASSATACEISKPAPANLAFSSIKASRAASRWVLA